jgi:serine/threonine protein kinase
MGRPKPLTSVQKAKLLSDHSGLQHVPRPADASVWIGGYGLGSGSYGEVSLWICLDEKTRKPIRECAIKDVFDTRPTEEKGIYKDIYHSLVAKDMDFGADPWTKYLGQARVDKRFYKEAYLQGIMTEHDSKQEIYSVPLWGYRRKKESLRPDFNHWRLYMSLYDYGDLYNVIYVHLVKQRGIPEPFIWHTIRCLLIGSEQLSDLPKKLEGATDSDVIVVFDMKPENILLAPPNQMSTFPTYPRPHIADLGGACTFTQPLRIIRGSCLRSCYAVDTARYYSRSSNIQRDPVAYST